MQVSEDEESLFRFLSLGYNSTDSAPIQEDLTVSTNVFSTGCVSKLNRRSYKIKNIDIETVTCSFESDSNITGENSKSTDVNPGLVEWSKGLPSFITYSESEAKETPSFCYEGSSKGLTNSPGSDVDMNLGLSEESDSDCNHDVVSNVGENLQPEGHGDLFQKIGHIDMNNQGPNSDFNVNSDKGSGFEEQFSEDSTMMNFDKVPNFEEQLSEDDCNIVDYPSYFKDQKPSDEIQVNADSLIGQSSPHKCSVTVEEIAHYKDEQKGKNATVKEILARISSSELDTDDDEEKCLLSDDMKNLNIISDLKSEPVGPNRMCDPPPGLRIIKDENIFCLFDESNLAFEVARSSKKRPSRFESHLMENPSLALKILPTAILYLQPSQIRNQKEFLTFLFKMVAVHHDITAINSGEETIKRFLSVQCPNSVRWCPTVDDLYTVFLNFGLDINSHCPIFHILENIEASILTNKDEKANSDWSFVAINFEAVIRILECVLRHCCNYSSSELSSIVILLLWASLDKKLLLTATQIAIQNCADVALSKISVENWPSELKFLAKELGKLGHHHKNILKIIRELKVISDRSHSLQKAAALMALQNFLGTSETVVIDEVQHIMYFLKLLRERLNKGELQDFSLVDTLIFLIDICVCALLPEMSVETLKSLCLLALSTASKITENSRFPERSEVREHLVRLRCSWIIHYPKDKMLENVEISSGNETDESDTDDGTSDSPYDDNTSNVCDDSEGDSVSEDFCYTFSASVDEIRVPDPASSAGEILSASSTVKMKGTQSDKLHSFLACDKPSGSDITHNSRSLNETEFPVTNNIEVRGKCSGFINSSVSACDKCNESQLTLNEECAQFCKAKSADNSRSRKSSNEMCECSYCQKNSFSTPASETRNADVGIENCLEMECGETANSEISVECSAGENPSVRSCSNGNSSITLPSSSVVAHSIAVPEGKSASIFKSVDNDIYKMPDLLGGEKSDVNSNSLDTHKCDGVSPSTKCAEHYGCNNIASLKTSSSSEQVCLTGESVGNHFGTVEFPLTTSIEMCECSYCVCSEYSTPGMCGSSNEESAESSSIAEVSMMSREVESGDYSKFRNSDKMSSFQCSYNQKTLLTSDTDVDAENCFKKECATVTQSLGIAVTNPGLVESPDISESLDNCRKSICKCGGVSPSTKPADHSNCNNIASLKTSGSSEQVYLVPLLTNESVGNNFGTMELPLISDDNVGSVCSGNSTLGACGSSNEKSAGSSSITEVSMVMSDEAESADGTKFRNSIDKRSSFQCSDSQTTLLTSDTDIDAENCFKKECSTTIQFSEIVVTTDCRQVEPKPLNITKFLAADDMNIPFDDSAFAVPSLPDHTYSRKVSSSSVAACSSLKLDFKNVSPDNVSEALPIHKISSEKTSLLHTEKGEPSIPLMSVQVTSVVGDISGKSNLGSSVPIQFQPCNGTSFPEKSQDVSSLSVNFLDSVLACDTRDSTYIPFISENTSGQTTETSVQEICGVFRPQLHYNSSHRNAHSIPFLEDVEPDVPHEIKQISDVFESVTSGTIKKGMTSKSTYIPFITENDAQDIGTPSVPVESAMVQNQTVVPINDIMPIKNYHFTDTPFFDHHNELSVYVKPEVLGTTTRQYASSGCIFNSGTATVLPSCTNPNSPVCEKIPMPSVTPPPQDLKTANKIPFILEAENLEDSIGLEALKCSGVTPTIEPAECSVSVKTCDTSVAPKITPEPVFFFMPSENYAVKTSFSAEVGASEKLAPHIHSSHDTCDNTTPPIVASNSFIMQSDRDGECTGSTPCNLDTCILNDNHLLVPQETTMCHSHPKEQQICNAQTPTSEPLQETSEAQIHCSKSDSDSNDCVFLKDIIFISLE